MPPGCPGFRLRPAALPHDLVQITENLVPELRRRGLFRNAYEVGHTPRATRTGRIPPTVTRPTDHR